MGAHLVPAKIECSELTVPLLDGSGKLPGLSGSASVRNKRLTVTLTNPSLQESVVTRIRLLGGVGLREARATVLTHEDMGATNTFDKPNEVGLAGMAAQVSADTATIRVPMRSVVAIALELA
jgi:alpha-N-arabinofuranosidase